MPQTPYVIGTTETPSTTRYRFFHECDHTAGLTVSGSSVGYDGVASHPGVLTINTGTPQYNQARFNIGQAATVRPFNVDDFKRLTWVFKYDSVTNIQGWFGFYGSNSGPTGDQTQTGSIMSFISGSTLTFQVNNASTSSTSTGITISANIWYKFDIVRLSSSSVSLYVNDVLAATVTTGVPSGSICGVGGRLMTLENPGAKIWYMDTVDALFETTSARY